MREPRPARPVHARRIPWLLLAVILAAAALRLVGLDRWPPGLHFDEAVYGLLAQEIVAGARPVYFPAYTGREPLYMYAMAVLFAAIGPTAWAIRLTSAFIGILTVPLTYALGRALYGRRVGLVAAALLAFSFWHLVVSRNGYPNILIPPIEAASLFCLWRGWRGGRRRDWAFGGALAGLVLYTYLAARFFPVFLAVLLVYAAVVDLPTWRRRLPGIGIALAAAALVFAPLGLYFWQHPADFVERANQVLAWQRHSGAELLDIYWGNLRRTALAFVVPGQGDPRWHYNLPGRAIFQPLVAGFLLVGFAICLRRMRDLRYAIPVLWIAVLTLPGLLTDEMQPAGQRIFGMFPALVLVPAVGLVAAGEWVGRSLVARAGPPRRFPLPQPFWGRGPGGGGRPARQASAVVVALATLVILLDGAITVRDYFGDWVRRPETAEIFNADYATVARAAARDIAEGRTPVILSQHYKHPTVVFLAPETVERAKWAEPLLALPVPHGFGAGGLAYYRLPSYLPDDAPATRWLEVRADDKQVIGLDSGDLTAPDTSAAGEPGDLAVIRYLVPRTLPSSEPVSPPVGGPLIGNREIEVPLESRGPIQEAPRDEPLIVPVEWAVIQPPRAARGFALHLRDADGTTWVQADGSGYLAEQWWAGDRVTSWFTLDLDRAMPPGLYTAHLILLDEAGQPLPWSGHVLDGSLDGAQIEPAGAAERRSFNGLAAPVATIRLLPDGARRVPEDAEPIHAFSDGLAILDADLPAGEIPPGGTFKAGLDWARLGAADGPPALTFALARDGQSIPIATVPIARDYPPAAWGERELLRGRYALRVPAEIEAGEHLLRVTRAVSQAVSPAVMQTVSPAVAGDPAGSAIAPVPGMPDGESFDLGPVTIGGPPRIFAPPPMGHAAEATFGGVVKLLGYDLEPDPPAPGAPLALTLYWQAIDTPGAEGKVFAHLFGPDGRPLAQHDGVPADGAHPFTGWLPGEVVVDRHVIEVPPNVDAADLALGVGIYDPETGGRWPLSAAGGGERDGRYVLR